LINKKKNKRKMRRENKKKREGHTWHVWRRKGFIRSERRERKREKCKGREKHVFGDFRDSGILIWSFLPTILPIVYRQNIKY